MGERHPAQRESGGARRIERRGRETVLSELFNRDRPAHEQPVDALGQPAEQIGHRLRMVAQRIAEVGLIERESVRRADGRTNRARRDADRGEGLVETAATDAGIRDQAAQAALQLLRGIQGYSVTSGDLPEVAQITAGRNLIGSDNGSSNVILPDSLRTGVPHLKTGDQLALVDPRTSQPANVSVVGFYKLTNSTFDINLNAGPIFGAQTLPMSIAGPNPSHIYYLRVPPAKVTQVEDQIGQALPGVFVFNFGDIAGLINRFLNNFVIAFTAIGALALIAGVVIVANAVALAMLERRRELGMLKALGYTSERVLSGVLLESALTAALGGLLGMVLVAVAVFAFSKLVSTEPGKSPFWFESEPMPSTLAPVAWYHSS